MKSTRFTLATLAAFLLAPALGAADPLPVTDNDKPPYLGVWKEPKLQPAQMKTYDAWLNRTRTWADISPCGFYALPKSWTEIENVFDPAFGAWVTEVPGRRALLTPPLLPANKGASTLAAGATGAYNSHFAALAANLVAHHLGDTIIYMGATNAWGMPLRVGSAADAALYVAYWKQVVSTMRAVPGAKFQFDWVLPSGNINFPIEAAYPGDDCVDYVGILLSEGCGDRTIYPYPTFASHSEKLYHQKMAWDRIYLPILEKADAFAKSHGKPFTIPQWNLAADHTRSEGFDAPVFIQSMFNYIQDPAHDVAFSCYMEYYHYSRLSPTDGYVSNEPESTEMFHRLFAVPAPAK